MREQLRNELLAALGTNMDAEALRAAERTIDAVISRYDVQPAETHLAVLGAMRWSAWSRRTSSCGAWRA